MILLFERGALKSGEKFIYKISDTNPKLSIEDRFASCPCREPFRDDEIRLHRRAAPVEVT